MTKSVIGQQIRYVSGFLFTNKTGTKLNSETARFSVPVLAGGNGKTKDAKSSAAGSIPNTTDPNDREYTCQDY